jgi:hypothetical protein
LGAPPRRIAYAGVSAGHPPLSVGATSLPHCVSFFTPVVLARILYVAFDIFRQREAARIRRWLIRSTEYEVLVLAAIQIPALTSKSASTLAWSPPAGPLTYLSPGHPTNTNTVRSQLDTLVRILNILARGLAR